MRREILDKRHYFQLLKSFKLFRSYLCALLLLPLFAEAQQERGLTRDGNKFFDKGKFADAEAQYKKALEKKNNFPEAVFNLGDALYKQQRYDEAAKQFELSAKLLTDPKLKAQSFHNNGNCHLEKKEWENAVSAYKQALKLNASDRDTKYNLAYANAKLKEQQQQNKDNKDNKQNQDQKKNEQDKKQQDQKDKQDKGDQKKEDKKEGKGDKDKEQKDQQQQPRKGSLSKEQAEKLLEALKNEEQKAQEKMQKKTAKPVEVKVEKDW